MNIKPLITEDDYNWALSELDPIFMSDINSEDGKKTQVLVVLIS
jgi:antitoxin component HigA of HigAB toxin-antitoxin module